MCGITGYIGSMQAVSVILEGLSRLEYRGYDSAGIAVFDGEKIRMEKAAGRLKVLEELTDHGKNMPGTCGIGHTRWATHGCPSDINAHPHMNEENTIAVVHNGIIENYDILKQRLLKKGYHFSSDTDTEVLVHMLTEYYRGNPVEAIEKVMHRVEGSYALGIMFKNHPHHIYAARKDSPLIIGFSDTGKYIASDVPAVLNQTRNVYYMENEEIACLSYEHIRFFNMDSEPVEKTPVTVDWDIDAAEKGGYEHFMLKEIYEQPKAFRDTISPRIKNGEIVLDELNMSDEELRKIRKIFLVACGSAYHTGAAAKYIIERLAGISAEADLASEFRYREPVYEEDSMVVIVSQSGETADSLAALRDAKAHGCRVIAIVNVVGSSIAREADAVLYTWAGPEISVATTKAYSCQLGVLYLLALKLAGVRGRLAKEQEKKMLDALCRLPEQMEEILKNKEKIQYFANHYLATEHIFFMGRGIDYAISMEASLKLKEISYIHSEAYAAGELKHGTISLVEPGTLVAAVATQDRLYAKTVSNIVEVKTRGAFVLALTTWKHKEMEKEADYVIFIPETEDVFMASLAILPLQLFAYYVSVGRGLDVDKPRNLAKSVTVE